MIKCTQRPHPLRPWQWGTQPIFSWSRQDLRNRFIFVWVISGFLLFHPGWLYTTRLLTLGRFPAAMQCSGKWGLHSGVAWPFRECWQSGSPKFPLQTRSCSSSVTAALPLLGVAFILMVCIPQFFPDDFKMEQNGVPVAHFFFQWPSNFPHPAPMPRRKYSSSSAAWTVGVRVVKPFTPQWWKLYIFL